MTLLNEHDALTEIRALLARAERASLAVAFWGKGAIERLGLERAGLSMRILCNLDSGACNPAELRRVRDLPGITIKAHPALHAKVYWTPDGAVLGSSNASANGLALEGDFAGAWAEANVRLDDPEILGNIASWFDALFAAGYDIDDADLDRAEQAWKARVEMAPTGKRLADDLFAAFSNAPGHPAWRQIKVAYCKDPLDALDQSWLDDQHDAGRLKSNISAYGQWNDRIAGNDWVLDFDLKGKKGQRPRFTGIWKALPVSHPNLRLVYEVKTLALAGFGRLALHEVDAARLGAIAPAVLAAHSADSGNNAVIDLATAHALLAAAEGEARKR